MTEKLDNKWIDILPKVVKTYNKTINSSTKVKPIDVINRKDSPHVKLYSDYYTKPSFKVGERVRISYVKGIFAKGYEYNWSIETYVIYEVKKTERLRIS